MSSQFLTDAYPEAAFPTDPLEAMTEMAKIAMSRAEAAEEQVEELTKTGLLEIDRLTTQRNLLRDLLELARQSMADCLDQREGHDVHEIGCPNCDGATPLPHSLGCRIDSALRGLR